MAEQLEHTEWPGKTGGMPWMQRSLVRILGKIDQRIVYFIMALFVVPGYMLFAHRGYLAQYHFFRQRLHESWWRAFCHVYVNHYRFGQIIIDRFAVFGGKQFKIESVGYDHWLELETHDEGFIQLSSHIGNYELAGYSLKAQRKMMNALVFLGETETVMRNRNKVFTPNNITMVPVMPDMSHIFVLNTALSNGEIVSMPADRIFGSQKALTCKFFGADAKFPLGPFSLAMARECPVLAVFVMKKNWQTYHIEIKDITAAVQSQSGWAEKRKNERLQAMVEQFAAELEAIVRQYPTQWFNYYEFWQ